MRTIEQATGQLRPDQRAAIAAVCDAADGHEHVDDLAFVSAILVALMCEHEQTPTGWAIVTAHKALLKMAANEGIIDHPPRVKHERVRRRLDELLLECQVNCQALNEECCNLRRLNDNEVSGLRVEIKQLREELARRDEADADRLRVREEDQKRRDELDRYPGSGAG